MAQVFAANSSGEHTRESGRQSGAQARRYTLVASVIPRCALRANVNVEHRARSDGRTEVRHETGSSIMADWKAVRDATRS
jgi:hypothetical protein